MKKIYEGKAKILYQTDNGENLICYFKDDATAFNGVKKSVIEGKGILNNKITEIVFNYLEKNGIETHFLKRISEREQLIKPAVIVPLEVIIRNYTAGSFSKRYGVKEGQKLTHPIFETSYKKDELNDPLINLDQAVALNLTTPEEYATLREKALIINNLLIKFFASANLILADFKLEFGRLKNGKLVLVDEFSPDNSRLWDTETLVPFDKDNFRKDLGNLMVAYKEVYKRIKHVHTKD